MNFARIGVLAAGVSASALLFGCSTDTGAPNAAQYAQTTAAVAAATPKTVDNFMLVDQNLEAHELYRLADAPAVVIVTTGNGCPIARSMAPGLKALKAAYAAKGVEFMMLNSNLQDTREAIQKEAKDYGYEMPVLLDSNQLVGESLGVTRTAEVFVINPKTWQVVYHGPLDDRTDYGGAQKANVTPYAANALDALLAGKPYVQQAALQTKGCLIDFPQRSAAAMTKISYAKDVAPILEAKCVACHQEGGIGPFAMSSYDMVKGFSPMIREVIRTHRMPPWNADPHVGAFQDDKSLSPDQIKTVVHWIEAGAPRGDGPDPLAAKRHVAQKWPLGTPDVILKVPAFDIPASGVVDYQRPFIPNPVTEGRWIRASTVNVSQRQGVHHILTGYMKDVPADGQGNESRWGASVGGYAVGSESTIAPTNAGTYLPPGGGIGIQAHYTPFGKEAVDNSEIGLYFYAKDKTPDLVMHNSVVVDNTIVLPPNDGHHQEIAYLEFPHDALLYSAFPHAHYRGAASDLWIRYPDGKEKLLLSLPRYDFNWQRDYTFATPVKVPAGSKLIVHYIYDNSKRNPHNPDPNKQVVWGDQSFEEMLYTAVRYRWLDETSKHLVNYDEDLNSNRFMGMMDDNIDGKLEKAELKGNIGATLLKYFDQIDVNHDGYLEANELKAAQAMMGRRRQAEAAPAAAPAKPTSPPTSGK
jgi:mono/diheme cytochrome c family protein